MKFRLLAIFIGLGMMSGVIACQSPTEGDAPPPATATASALQSTTPSTEPATAQVREPCQSEQGFEYGAEVLAHYEGGLVYEDADPQSDHLKPTKHHQEVEIVGTSVCVENRIWWPIEYGGREGWIMELSLALKPDPGPCALDWRPDVADNRWRKYSDFAVTYQDLVVDELVALWGEDTEDGEYSLIRERLDQARTAINGPRCGQYIRVPEGF